MLLTDWTIGGRGLPPPGEQHEGDRANSEAVTAGHGGGSSAPARHWHLHRAMHWYNH